MAPEMLEMSSNMVSTKVPLYFVSPWTNQNQLYAAKFTDCFVSVHMESKGLLIYFLPLILYPT
jgi:hypothetical protein